ncbi:MAG: hypothetical protein QG602_1477 [Verrucomicrobiota bacterium]|nr:hypothetical protein [Verrucomicrobiota bacterium]
MSSSVEPNHPPGENPPAAQIGSRRRDEALLLALDATLTSIWDYDLTTGLLTLDANWSRMCSGPAETTVTRIENLIARLHPDDRLRAHRATLACVTGRTDVYSEEYRVLDEHAQWIWVHTRGRASHRDATGRATRMIGTNIDITQRKTSELAASRQIEFLNALNQTTLALLQRRAKSEILEALAVRAAGLLDSAQVEVALVEGDEIVTHAFGGTVRTRGGTRARREEAVLSWRAVDSREAVFVERYAALPEGSSIYRQAQFQAVALFPILHGQRCLGVLGFLRERSGHGFNEEERQKGRLLAQLAALVIHNADIYEDAVRVAAERTAALNEHERVFHNFIEKINQGFYIADRRSVFTYCNPAISHVTGWSEAELLGTSAFRLVAPEDRPRVIALYRQLAESAKNDAVVEFRIEAKGGRPIWVEQSTVVQRDRDGRVAGYRNFLRDITERRAAEAALRESEAMFKGVFDASPIPIILLSYPEGRIQAMNQASVSVFGFSREEVVGKTTSELNVWSDPAERDTLMRKLAEGHNLHMAEVGLRRRDGSLIDVLYNVGRLMIAGRPCMLASVIDITAQKQAESALRKSEAKLRQVQKMESLGTLAGGIAHDFNNILTGILGFAHLCQADLDPAHPAANWIDGILKSGERAKGLVQQILTFSRKTESIRGPIRLQFVTQESLALLRSTLPAMVRLEAAIDPACPPVMADPTEIHQVILNLCTNAWHALPDIGGQIEVRLQPETVDAAFAREHPAVKPGPQVRLSVRDNGKGMNAATLERIFDPFFTTKEAGKGTGLGLAVVHSIVESHGGAILVQSTPGQGTTFDIFLPALAESAPAEEPPAASANLLRGQGQSLLIVDDEAMSGTVIARLAEKYGYRTTYCDDPLQAIALLYANDFDMLVTDLAMPGLPGDELARQALARKPGLPVLMLSGFIEPATTEKLRGLGVREILNKPPTAEDLLGALHRCLRA